ncbi:VOC family protein [Streptomyces bacillaris]|uniref:VOC family protein n=1 Tax=Streptomyces bacillaris TaxID=68179 RepID=UPI0036531A85
MHPPPSNCAPATPSTPRSSTPRCSAGTPSNPTAARSATPTSRTPSSSATAATPWPLCAAAATGRPPTPGCAPRWHVRFQVDDLTAATEAARKAGGEVSPPTVSADDGPESMIEDPDGALFTVSARRSPTPAG